MLALIASNETLLVEVADALRREGVKVLTLVADSRLTAGSVPDAIEKGVLIQSEKTEVTIGEQISRVRSALLSGQELVVCCAQPTPADRVALLECGATSV